MIGGGKYSHARDDDGAATEFDDSTDGTILFRRSTTNKYYWPAPPRSLAHDGEAFGRLSGTTTTRPVPPTPLDGRHTAVGGAGVTRDVCRAHLFSSGPRSRPLAAIPGPGDQHSHPTPSPLPHPPHHQKPSSVEFRYVLWGVVRKEGGDLGVPLPQLYLYFCRPWASRFCRFTPPRKKTITLKTINDFFVIKCRLTTR